jgi:aminoglycoside phosphotransferase family enzyme/predicted kinase
MRGAWRGDMDLKEALLRPDAYPAPVSRIELIETHISWVFLADRNVYKVKKPVDFGFLDFRSIAQRLHACEAEVRLNARLAPDVYRGVVAVRRGPDGICRIDGPGETVDWAVEMSRLPEERRADNLLERGQLGGEQIDALADRLAEFHAAARCDADTARFGSVDAIDRNVLENFAQTRGLVDRYVRRAEVEEIESWQRSVLRQNARLFEGRVAAGRIRDGHGDLRLEHVYLDERHVRIIDCIEFNERFRFGDVCADIAFLSMDLAWHRRVDLAERFLARYALHANDFDLYALIDFYESYRAYVRAKVAMLFAADERVDEQVRRRAEAEARRYLLLALSTARRPLLPPALVCVGGVIASGKSTISAHVARELSAPVVEADRTRKHMLGIAPGVHVVEPPWQGAYDRQVTERVYAEMLRRARVVLSSGRPVVIDASFRTSDLRQRARDLAAACLVPFVFVECQAPPDVCRRRLQRRESESGVSDARLPLFDDFCARYERPDELSPTEHVVLNTALPLEDSLAAVRAHLGTWPRGLVA